MKKSFLIILSAVATLSSAVLFSSCSRECKHEFLTIKKVDVSCINEGYTLNKCSKCSLRIKTDIVSKKEHTRSKEIFSPNCTESGYTLYSCECGESYCSDFTNPLGHSFDVFTVLPTCTNQGYKVYSCSRCDHTFESDFVSPLGHSLSASSTVLPTCTEQGLTHYRCSECDYEFDSDYVKPTGHSFDSIITTPPTSFSPGKTECSCNCGYKFANNIYPTELHKGAYVDGSEILANGIDVSKWNGDINWREIKDSGIDFVIIRAGYSSVKDPKFEANYAAAKAAGLDVGCYYYSYATSVAQMSADADSFMALIAGKQFEYPVYLDLEDPSQQNIDREILFDMCRAFIEKLQSNKYFCGLYVNSNWLYNVLNTSMTSTYFDIWIARYWDNTSVWSEDIMGSRTGMWQYTDSGKIGSHNCNFDMNVAFKDYPSLIKEWGLNGF